MQVIGIKDFYEKTSVIYEKISLIVKKFPWLWKNFLDRVDFPIKTLYNSKACKISDEVRCGYSLWNTKVGGNSYGVCRGLDQGGKLFKIFDFRR